METNCLILLICISICLAATLSILIIYCFKCRIKKMEFAHKETLEAKRTEKKQQDELIESIKEKVLEGIKNQVSEKVDEKFEGKLTERVKKLEEQIKSKIC